MTTAQEIDSDVEVVVGIEIKFNAENINENKGPLFRYGVRRTWIMLLKGSNSPFLA